MVPKKLIFMSPHITLANATTGGARKPPRPKYIFHFFRSVIGERGGSHIPLFIIGNKTDKERMMVREEMEVLVRDRWGAMYLECCAKRKDDVSSVFSKIVTFFRRTAIFKEFYVLQR